MVSQAAMGANEFLDTASIFSVALAGGMLGAALALFLRLLVICFSALYECCPEEEAMVVILTHPDEKETPLLLQARPHPVPLCFRLMQGWDVCVGSRVRRRVLFCASESLWEGWMWDP